MSTSTVLDRYVQARFPGHLRRAADLADIPAVVDTARLYFDERRIDRAIELLDLAISRAREEEPLHLARLEIFFLIRDTGRFARHAREFRELHGKSAAWDEVMRLGRALAPADDLFGARHGPRAFEHYGPWPHTPNWINASWDLRPDVHSSDYHAAMAEEAAAAAPMQNAA